MTLKDAYIRITKEYPILTVIDCVDLNDRYGFTMVEWNTEKFGQIDKKKAYDLFLITGWFTVDKKNGSIGEQNAISYYMANPEAIETVKILPIPIK